jgi:hypothetical protein
VEQTQHAQTHLKTLLKETIPAVILKNTNTSFAPQQQSVNARMFELLDKIIQGHAEQGDTAGHGQLQITPVERNLLGISRVDDHDDSVSDTSTEMPVAKALNAYLCAFAKRFFCLAWFVPSNCIHGPTGKQRNQAKGWLNHAESLETLADKPWKPLALLLNQQLGRLDQREDAGIGTRTLPNLRVVMRHLW